MVEAHTESALEHIIRIVHIRHRAVTRYAVIFLQSEVSLFPYHERVEHIHKLSVAKALTILGKAILRESLAGPYGVNLLAQHVHTDVLRVLTECLHLLVRLLGREITVHLTIDEVNLDVRI